MPDLLVQDGRGEPAVNADTRVGAEGQPGSSPIRRRLLRGLGATALGPIVTMIVQLVTVPWLLHSWGAAKYGDWLILSAIPSYLGLSDLGFGDASGSDMTMRVAAGDRKGALETFQSSWALLSLVSLGVASIVSSTVWYVPWHRWVKLATLSDSRASLVVCVLAIYILVSQQCGILESGFRCDGNFATGTVGGTLLRTLDIAAGTIVGILTGNLFWAAAAYLISRVVGTLTYWLVLRQKSPWISVGFSHAHFSRVKELAAPAAGFVALPLASAISLQGFTLVVASVLGSVAVVQFSTLRTLTRVNFQISNMLSCTIWPELSRAFGEGNVPLARALHRRAYQASLALSVAVGVALWVVGPAIYRLWIRNGVPFNSTCFNILLLVSFAGSLWYTSSVVPMSTNAHHWLTLAFVGLSLFSLALGRILSAHFGLGGAAVALLAIDIPMTYLVLRTSLRQLQEKLGDFLRAIMIAPSKFLLGLG